MVLIPGSGRSPGEGNGNPLQFLAWKTPWTEEPGWLQSMGSQRVRHPTEHTHTTAIFRIKSKCLSKCYIEFPHPLTITFPSDFIYSSMPSQLTMFPKDSLCSLALTFPPQKSFFPVNLTVPPHPSMSCTKSHILGILSQPSSLS